MANQVQIDVTKPDLVLIINFKGVMNLGYAVFLLSGNTSIWNPPKTGNSMNNGVSILLPPNPNLDYYNNKDLDLEFAFIGKDSILKDYQITAQLFQGGEKIGNQFSVSGQLDGKIQSESIEISIQINK